MTATEMKRRTKQFALQVVKFVQALPRDRIAQTLGSQLLRSGTSVGANYRAAQRARSHAEYLSKMGIVEEEVDESSYWLELLVEAGIVPASRVESLVGEADEIVRIVVAAIKSAKQHDQRRVAPKRPQP